jgi:hypothetical protein
MVVEGTKESHMDKRTTPLPPHVKLHEWRNSRRNNWANRKPEDQVHHEKTP